MESAVSFEGETGPYVQYTYARINSVLAKVKEPNNVSENGQVTSSNDTEFNDVAGHAAKVGDASWTLLKLLADYPQYLEKPLGAMNLR